MAAETGAAVVEKRAGLPKEAILPRWVREPHRFWSLWDLMKEVDPQLLGEILYFCDLTGQFSGMRDVLSKIGLPHERLTVNDGSVPLHEPEAIAELFVSYGLPRSAEIILEWSNRYPRYDGVPLEVVVPELQRSIERELRANLFLHVEDKNRKFFEGKNHFGDAVTAAFPSTSLDLEEAGKCYAVARHTACVFHLMRVMEVALRVLALTLNDPRLDPKRNPSWDSILRKCREELAKERSKRAPEWAKDDTFFSGTAERLMGVKDAWRNPTMHVDIDYDGDLAMDVWNHVGSFMRHLATKLREKN